MPKDYNYLSKRRKNQLRNKEIANANGIDNNNTVSQSSFDTQNYETPPINQHSTEPEKQMICHNTGLCHAEQSISSTSNCNLSDSLSEESFSDLYDDSRLDTDHTDKIAKGLGVNLCAWVIEHNISKNAVDNLLKILKLHGHNDLPVSSRTLLKTPRSAACSIIAKNGGHYVHFGLVQCLTRSARKYSQVIPNAMKLNINVDGLPVSKSSGSQFWPVLASIETNFYTEPFVIGIHHGNSKPTSANEFLKPFVDEMITVLQEGICIDDQLCKVTINAIVCDAPAKSFVTYTKGHSGYFACTKCVQEGDFICNRVTFPETNCTLRTDESFRKRQQPEHHIGDSILEMLDINMISQIVLDDTHLTKLGVMTRLLQFWVKGTRDVRLPAQILNSASENLVAMKPSITSEFARKPRSLFEIDRWKATEFRQFLLYTGPVLLKPFLNKHYYLHFLSLSIAIRILSDNESCLAMVEYAESLLLWFVTHYGDLYGYEYISHNVHNLIHLASDVKKFGGLENFSSFKFENHMQKLKKKIKQTGKPLQEISNRIFEEHLLPLKFNYAKQYHITHYSKQLPDELISHVEFEGFSISRKENNNVCLLHDGSVALVIDIFTENQILSLRVRRFINTESLFNVPLDSKKLGISVIFEHSESTLTQISALQIKNKCLKLKSLEHQNAYVIVPLLHANN